jgi:3'-phosphoadenosine 5'-phosphosulfate sulfotransferase (PAPS reductase)/FAD synthetase
MNCSVRYGELYMKKDKVRHILGLSGGKDSTALAILLHKEIEDLEFFFCDTHKELPETYRYLELIEARLGIKIHRLSAEKGFDYWLTMFNGYLPSPKSRWCTRKLKIEPLEKFIGDDETISYIGIRADENRDGYISKRHNIKPVYPFKDRGLVKEDIYRIIEESGIGFPEYYQWRSRSGCYFCFFQAKYEWVNLSETHPDLFQESVKYETFHKDGRVYTWNDNETLEEIVKIKDKVFEDHRIKLERLKKQSPNKSLTEALEDILQEEEIELPCLMCHL